jgi:hypothetical protein
MNYSKRFFDNLPINAKLADDLGLLEQFCDVGIQPMLDTVWRLMDAREQFFDPTHPAAMYHLAFLAQFVGLAGTRNRWLGLGLNPDWDSATQLDVILRAPKYYKIQGTNPGIIEAISMWLRYDGAIRLFQPFGDTPTESPPRWADYFTPYDQYELRNFEDARILGLTDYSSILNVDRKWRRFVATSYEWDYNESFGYALAEAPANPTNYVDPGMGPRNAWKFFYLDKTTWNQVFGDIHKLDREILPSLTRPINVGWLSYTQPLELRSPYKESETNVIKEIWYDVDGVKYQDVFPFLVRYTDVTTIVTKTTQEWHLGNYFACFQYYDLLPILPGITDGESLPIERIVQVDGYFPCANYGDVPSELIGTSQDLREKNLRIVTEPGIYPGFDYNDSLAATTQITKIETSTLSDAGGSGFDINSDYYTSYEEAIFSWHGFTETSVTTTLEILVTPACSFYTPSYQYWEEVIQEESDQPSPRSSNDWMIGAYSFDAFFQEKSERITTEVEEGNYGNCLAWEYVGDEQVSDQVVNAAPSVTIHDGYYPGATYGDSWQQLTIEYATEWSDGNLLAAADYFIPYTTVVYPNSVQDLTPELVLEWAEEVEEDLLGNTKVACWYYPPQEMQYTVLHEEPPFRTQAEVEQSAFAGMVYDSVEYREVGDPSSYSDYFTPLWAPLPFFTPKIVEPIFISPVWVGGTRCFYAPAIQEIEEPPSLPTAESEPSLAVIASFDAIVPFYRPPAVVAHRTITEFPAMTEGGQRPYYAPAYSYTEVIVQHESEALLQKLVPPSFYMPPYETITVETTEVTEQEEVCSPGLITDKVTGYREIPSPLPPNDLPQMQMRYLDAVHTEVTTTAWDNGHYPGATYEDAFSWIAINQIVSVETRVVEIPVLPTNQLFAPIQAKSVITDTDIFYSGNEFGSGYDQPFVFSAIPDIWFDSFDADIDVSIPEPEGIDTSVLGEVENPEAPFNFIYPFESLAVDESDFFYYPSSKTVIQVETVTPDGYKLVEPIAIATYETPFDQMKEYWIQPQEPGSRVETEIKREDFVVPGVPFFAPPSKEEVTISLDEASGWEIARGFPPEYLTIFGASTSFTDFLYVPVVALPPTKVPIVEEVQWCGIRDLFTTFEITQWFEEIVELPATYYSLDVTHPQFEAIKIAENWRWVLETDTGLIITTPTTIYWTRSSTFSSIMKERSLSFDKENGFTNLYLEFVIEPDADWLAFGGTLNVDSQGIISDNFDKPLRISKKSVLGFRFLIPTALVYA